MRIGGGHAAAHANRFCQPWRSDTAEVRQPVVPGFGPRMPVATVVQPASGEANGCPTHTVGRRYGPCNGNISPVTIGIRRIAGLRRAAAPAVRPQARRTSSFAN
jgi:hypothetical protein